MKQIFLLVWILEKTETRNVRLEKNGDIEYRTTV